MLEDKLVLCAVVQAAATVALVAVTIYYASKTARIAEGTRALANATESLAERTGTLAEETARMAEATEGSAATSARQAVLSYHAIRDARLARLDVARPLLALQDAQAGTNPKGQRRVHIVIRNAGTGPALGPRLEWTCGASRSTDHRSLPLHPGDSWQSNSPVLGPDCHGPARVAVDLRYDHPSGLAHYRQGAYLSLPAEERGVCGVEVDELTTEAEVPSTGRLMADVGPAPQEPRAAAR